MSLNISFSGIPESPDLLQPSFLEEKFKRFQETVNDPSIGFFKLPESNELLQETKSVFDRFKGKTTFVHVGIGGSSLGPEMLTSALAKNQDVNFIYINNIDPDQIHDQLQNLDIEKTLFYFVSKSGGTAETMAGLSIAHNILEKAGVSKEQYSNYMVFATDPTKSQLLDLGKELGIDCLKIPSNVGGRFSVLTPVAFLPALFAGIDCDKLLSGAQKMAETVTNTPPVENILLQMASRLMELRNRGVGQTVFMPYSSKLRNLSFWFVQLWAESLGKRVNCNGEIVNTGLTPIPAYGATDQHSQMQLFMEGPYDKCLLLLDFNRFKNDMALKNNFSQPALSSLSSLNLGELMKAEFEGTLKALEECKRPYIRLNMEENDEDNLGGLILLLESLTALIGHYLNIDPFDQPGVEAGKRYAKQWLDT